MSVELNHTLVHVRGTWPAAREAVAVLGRAGPAAYDPFAALELELPTRPHVSGEAAS